MQDMRSAALGLLAFVAGCDALAGLEGDYVVGSTGAGGSAGGSTVSGAPTGSLGGGGTSIGGSGGTSTGTATGTGGAGAAGATGGGEPGYCEEAGLVACYPFEGNGQDESMTGNDASTVSVQYAAGRVGQAIRLDASSRVTVEPSPSLAVSAFTLEVWLNPSSLPGQGERFGIGDWTTVFNAWVYSFGVRCYTDTSLGTVGAPIPANQWTHVACAHDGTTMRTYVNGVETASEGYVPDGAAPTMVSFIGANEPDGDDNFLGSIDEMRLFDHARSPEQICAAVPDCP